jgi:multidrug efflux pump subunit AcrA (membrane-fusion protein)
MYADAEIAVGGSDEGLFLKQGAIQDLHGQSIVFVKSGDHAFTLRAVETGAPLDGMRRVISGVNAGEQVVVDGSFLLKSKLLEASLVEE